MSTIFGVKLEQCARYSGSGSFNEVTARLISVLSQVNPRNLSEAARMLGISPSLAHYHVKRLFDKGLLSISAIVNYRRAGLRLATVFFDIPLSRRRVVEEVFEEFDYWRCIIPCYGRFNGYYANFVIPVGKESLFKQFLDSLRHYGLVRNYELYWISNLVLISRGFKWFDFRKRQWNFKWCKWIHDVCDGHGTVKLRVLLEEDNVNKAVFMPDSVDIFILKELEMNALASFKEIADKLGVTPPAIRYHYYNHVLPFKLIIGFRPLILPYPPEISDLHIFTVKFDDPDLMLKFVGSLDEKPFSSFAMVIEKRGEVIMDAYLPKTEFLNFIDTLSNLADIGFISDFNFVTLDLKRSREQTIPHKCFDKGRWIYHHSKYIDAIKLAAEKAMRFESIIRPSAI